MTVLGSLSMDWRHVLFANWPVEPEVVRPHVPDAMTLDTFDGEAWLSVVPFTNEDVRPPWFPEGVGVRLPELNLRTYVVVDDRPGVYFFSLDARGVASVLGARVFHHLPYYYARISLSEHEGRVRFRSRRRHPGARPLHFEATYGPTGEQFTAEPGSLEAFLVERYRYYTEDGSGAVRYADISHEPWPLFRAEVDIQPGDVFRANRFDPPETDPTFYYSPGVDVRASGSKLL